ncbi:DinB family protein [Tamlana crocina]|uniref:DinB family protein n=1 Tax=Tamlana crocina TaxID=393006 RepID=A0ABX1DF87_9FLAO|nr:DinB family protein [Tamlana crocina]NJX16399.1 DinB family protein [Tamlana crocina]
MDIIIQSTLKTLQKSQVLLNSISNAQLCDASIPPYHSSIGTHIRHILDFYDCIFKRNSEGKIDLTARSRNKDVESNCNCALNYLNAIEQKLKEKPLNTTETVWAIDDLGMGKTEIPYTLGALLAQANSHTIHHYAIINYILEGLQIETTDSNFGYNPSTPKQTPVG